MIREKSGHACHILCLILLLVAAAAHIAYGSLFIRWGNHLYNFQGASEQVYLNNLPLGAFTITIGIIMAIIILCQLVVLTLKMSWGAQLTFWMTTWLMCSFNFAVAFLEIRQFVYQDKTFTKFHTPIPSNIQFTGQYYLGLADGIFTFVVTLPASLQLVYLANYRFAEADIRGRIMVDPSPNPQAPLVKALPENDREESGRMLIEKPVAPEPARASFINEPMHEMNEPIKEEEELEESPRNQMEKTGALEFRPQIVRNDEEETGQAGQTGEQEVPKEEEVPNEEEVPKEEEIRDDE